VDQASIEAFADDPIGRYVVAGSSVVWCASPSLAGASTWGAPDVETTRAILKPFEAVWSKSMSDQVDILLDGSRIERIDPDALSMLVAWNVERRDAIVRRVRQQIGVVPRGIIGVTLAGILPTIGETHPFRVVNDVAEAFRMLCGERAEVLCREVEALVDASTGTSSEVRGLRELLRTKRASLTVAEAARALGLSTRSLQRSLGAAGTSFQRELRDARFVEASALLASTGEKIAAIASRVGVTEGALTQLFRERAGCTPAEYRRARSS